jgi:hypothetical protein
VTKHWNYAEKIFFPSSNKVTEQFPNLVKQIGKIFGLENKEKEITLMSGFKLKTGAGRRWGKVVD